MSVCLKVKLVGRIMPEFEFNLKVLKLRQKNKQTNKQTNRKNVGRDTATAVANYSGPGNIRICVTKRKKPIVSVT